MTTLLLDIGNSFVESATWEAGCFSLQKRFPTTGLKREFSALFTPNIQHIVVSSVVPNCDKLLQTSLPPTFTNLHFVSWQNIPLITLNLSAPEQVGADRLVNAMAAYAKVQNSVLVIDCGTATTCCYVDKCGVYQGGAIMPGMRLASQALHDHTAKIPLVFVAPRETLFGRNTEEAVQSGLFHSHVFGINGFIAACRKDAPEVTIVGTGNGLEPIKHALDLDLFDPHLIFHGLGICADSAFSSAKLS